MLSVRFDLIKALASGPPFLLILITGCATGGGLGPIPDDDPAPRIIYFKATPPNVIPGKPVLLEWRTDNAEEAEIEGIGGVPIHGSREIVPTRSTYVLTVSNATGRTIREEVHIGGTDVPIMATPPPQVIFFRANPPSVIAGDVAQLEWRVAFAESVRISGIGEVAPEGSRSVDPQQQANYRLTARNSKGQTATEEVSIAVAYLRIIEPQQDSDNAPLRRIEEPVRSPDTRIMTPGTLRIVGGLPAPRLVAPANGARFDHFPRKTRLRWLPVRGAASYSVEVQYCQRVGCATNVRTLRLKEKLRSTEYVFDFVGAQPGRWRVWPVDTNGKPGRKSQWWEFRYTR